MKVKKKGDLAVCYIFPTSDKVGHDNNRLGRNGIQNMILGERGKYARRKKWKRVFLAPDMSFEQREEERKKEKKLREEADRKSDEAKNEGRGKRYLVVGMRGRRRIIEVEMRQWN